MKEIDEKLILYLAGELEPHAKQELENRLALDGSLRRELDALRGVLKLAQDQIPAEPGERYWLGFWGRLQPRLERDSWWRKLVDWIAPRHGLQLATVAGVITAGFIVAFVLVHQIIVPPEPVTEVRTTTITVKRTEGFLEQAAVSHLERSRLLLQDVVNAAASRELPIERVMFSRDRGEALLSQNRSFRQAAEHQRNRKLAELLEELELVLMDIANLDPEIASEALKSLQRRIEKKKLLDKIETVESLSESPANGNSDKEVI